MYIYKNIIEEDFLIKVGATEYKMKINGWACGGFSATSDTEALEIFRGIIKGEN